MSLEFGDDGMDARELIATEKQERTALWTHNLLHAIRSLFLFCHGLVVVQVSMSSGTSSKIEWMNHFTPIWIGDLICASLLIWACFASCPYIKLCLAESEPRYGENNPSILTDILPDVIFSVLGFIYLIFLFVGEYLLFSYLQYGGSLVSALAFLTIVSCVAICHGINFIPNSSFFLLVGCGSLAAAWAFFFTHGGNSELPANDDWMFMAPFDIVFFGLVAVSCRRMFASLHVLSLQERILRGLECVMLVAASASTTALTLKIAHNQWETCEVPGVILGASLMLISLIRLGVCWIAWFTRSVDERLNELVLLGSPQRGRANSREVAFLSHESQPCARPGPAAQPKPLLGPLEQEGLALAC